MGRSHGFGSTTAYWLPSKVILCRDSFALFRLAFAAAPVFNLNLAVNRHSPVHSTKGTLSHLSESPKSNAFWGDVVLQLFVSTRFQVLFHSPPGVLFTFPSRYCFAIGRQAVFSLGRWSSLLPTGFLVSRGTRGPSWSALNFAYRAVTSSGRPFQTSSAILRVCSPFKTPHNPDTRRCRFGLLPFRSPLLRESRLSPAQVTRMLRSLFR